MFMLENFSKNKFELAPYVKVQGPSKEFCPTNTSGKKQSDKINFMNWKNEECISSFTHKGIVNNEAFMHLLQTQGQRLSFGH